MRISDWSSDVCSSDLEGTGAYPTAYSDGGFGSTLDSAKMNAAGAAAMMAKGEMPPMIWVILDHHIATGTHEFADSANNGPWGAALTTEAIPALEAKYRMDARASRSEERRVGKECVRTCRSRWSPYH